MGAKGSQTAKRNYKGTANAKKQRNDKADATADKPIAHGDAKIIKPFISTNLDTGRVAIHAKCTMADGSTREICILEVRRAHTANFASIGQKLMAMANEGSMTKGDMVRAKDAMLAE